VAIAPARRAPGGPSRAACSCGISSLPSTGGAGVWFMAAMRCRGRHALRQRAGMLSGWPGSIGATGAIQPRVAASW
jgi:hypothetical protein